MDEEKLKALYEGVSKDYNLGTYEEFSRKLSDPSKRKAFYEGVGKEYSLGSYEDFNKKLGKQSAVSSRGSKSTAVTSTEPSQPSPTNIVSNPFGGQTQEQFIGADNAKRIKSESAKQKLTLNIPKQPKPTGIEVINRDLAEKRAQKIEEKGTDVLNSLAVGLNQTYSGLAKTPRYIYEVASIPQNLLANAVENAAGEDLLAGIRTNSKSYDSLLASSPLVSSPLTALDKLGDFYQNQSEDYQAKQVKYDKGIFDSFANGNLGEAGAQLVNNIAQSAPSMLLMAGTSGIGTAGKLGSVNRTLLNALPFASSKANEIRDDETIPEAIKPIYSGLFGLAEVVYDQSFGTQAIINKLTKTFAESGREVAEKEAKDIATGYLRTAFNKIKEPLSDIRNNAIEEGVTQLSQNLLKWIVEDPNTDLMEGVYDVLITGAATGGVLGSVNTVIKSATKASIEQKNQQIENLSKDLDNPDIDETSKEIIIDKIGAIKEEIVGELTVEKESFDKLPESQKEEALEVVARKNTVENSLANPNISEDTKATLTEESKVLDNRLNEITKTTESNREQLLQIINDESIPADSNVKFDAQQQLDALDANEQNTEDIAIEETVPTPAPDKIQEIRDRRAEIFTRIRQKASNLNSGLNPEVLSDLIELGATYIEEGVVRFKDFAERLRSDYNNEITDEELRDIYRQSANQLGYNVRGFAENVRTNETLSEETRSSADDLDTLYQTQNYEEIGNRLDEMDESEKVAAVTRLERITSELTPQDNIGVLAGINLIDQYNSSGETAKAQSIIDTLMKSATVAAQTLRQYGEFKRATPDGFLELVKARLEGKELTPEQEQQIRDLFQDVKDYKANYEQAQQTLLNDINKTNRKARREALIAVEDAQRSLDDLIDSIKGSDVYETLSSILQGNLLTLKSVIQNPVANALQAGIGGLSNLASIPIDALLSLRTGNRSRFGNFSQDNLRNQNYAISEGVASANRKAIRGSTSTELTKYDTSSRLKPFEAFKRLFIDSFFKSRRDARQYNFEQGISDAFEGTTGQVANFFFRTLPYGDDPFYQLGRQNELNRIAKTRKLTGEEYDRFIIQPDKQAEEMADKAGKAQTFQNDTIISRFFNQVVNSSSNISNRHVRGVVKLVTKAIAPFVKTPSSVALKTVDFAAPIIPFMRSMYNMNELRKLTANGKSTPKATIDRYQSEASKDMGTAIVGTILGGIATVLIREGLVTGNAPEDKERKKEKDFMYATQPPNTINISGLRRLLNGESAEYKQGDIVNSYIPLGLAGSVIGITESTMGNDIREKQKQSRFLDTKGQPFFPQEEDNYIYDYLGNFISNIPASAQFMMQQSFLQGTSELLQAMSTGNFNNLTPQFTKTFSNIGIPNQVSQIYRATNENLRDVYTSDKWETLVNVLQERYGDIKDLPKKYNMWGEPIKQSPEGTNPYIYQMVDIFRTQPVLKDKLTHQVFNLYKKTSDNSVIPSSVKDFYKQGDFNVKLTDLQMSRLSELVGQERKKLATKVMSKYNPQEADMKKLDKLADRLATAYSDGAKRGKLRFKKELKVVK